MEVTDLTRTKYTFGFDRLDDQLSKMQQVMTHTEHAGREVSSVNLMYAKQIPVVFGGYRHREFGWWRASGGGFSQRAGGQNSDSDGGGFSWGVRGKSCAALESVGGGWWQLGWGCGRFGSEGNGIVHCAG
jgi:hypothetical protein